MIILEKRKHTFSDVWTFLLAEGMNLTGDLQEDVGQFGFAIECGLISLKNRVQIVIQ